MGNEKGRNTNASLQHDMQADAKLLAEMEGKTYFIDFVFVCLMCSFQMFNQKFYLFFCLFIYCSPFTYFSLFSFFLFHRNRTERKFTTPK
jgi:hypothetical protein